MSLARSFFLLFFVVSLAATAFAADKAEQPEPSPGSQNSIATSVLLPAQSGQDFSTSSPVTLNHPPVPRTPLATLDDGVCYTMRTYKVKPKEHFADNESGSRGYSTCELASNYQVRSAVAHSWEPQQSDVGRTGRTQK